MLLLSWIIFSIDPDGEENELDVVKDFTALVIVVEIDNIIIGFSDIQFSELEFEF